MKKLAVIGLFFLAACGGDKPKPVDITKTFTIQGDGISIEGSLKEGAKVNADVYKAGLQQAIKKK